jgi:outer membrane immunogenic protein
MKNQKSLFVSAAAAVMLVSSAMAADMPFYKAPVAIAPNWTGCYVGGNVGGGWLHTNIYDVGNSLDTGSDTGYGIVGGGQIGCDYQIGSWVVGAQGMFDWTDISASHNHPIGATEVLGTRAKWFSTLSARLGYSIQPQLLAYLKGGVAWLHNDYTDNDPNFGYWGQTSATRTGWTIGGGLEYAVLHNWSLFLEYDYLDFGTARSNMSYVGNCFSFCSSWPYDYKHNLQTVLVGLNYRFGP